MISFEGKTALITGAGGGIGAATARLLAAHGARVAVADLNRSAAEHVAAEIGPGRALAVEVDLAEEESIRASIEDTVAVFGRLDILDNNAADLSPSQSAHDGDVEHMSAEVWDRAFRVNVRGTMLACRYALPHMVAQGGGAIVNTASNLALQGNVIQAAYSASKAAVIQLTRSIATSHGRAGVRANCVSPGMTLSQAALSHLPPRLREIVESETLTPYLGAPDDIAFAVAFLASDAARYLNGHNLVVDGGTASHVPGFAALREMFGVARRA